MKTLIDIDDKLLYEVIRVSGAKTKKGAMVIAIKDYLAMKKRMALKGLIGGYDSFMLDLKKLERMRSE